MRPRHLWCGTEASLERCRGAWGSKCVQSLDPAAKWSENEIQTWGHLKGPYFLRAFSFNGFPCAPFHSTYLPGPLDGDIGERMNIVMF